MNEASRILRMVEQDPMLFLSKNNEAYDQFLCDDEEDEDYDSS